VFQIKVEILLPLYYNDKKRIEEEKYLITYDEIVERFRGCTIDNTPLIGGWADPDTKEKYEDESIAYWIVCKRTKENVTFLRKLKGTLKKRFKQLDIMMYYVSIYQF
jgi:hypothetical protein